MQHRSQRVRFANSKGLFLSGIIEWPVEPTKRFAIFSHCFTCTKDLKAIVRISRCLATHGIAVLRFDFTGLGDSQGDFSSTTFVDNQSDVVAAAEYLRANFESPQLLIGHSLGGAAMISSAPRISSVQGVVTIASPSDTLHLANLLSRMNPDIEQTGSGTVVIGGRTHLIRVGMIEQLRRTDLPTAFRELRMPLLIFFPLEDETLPFRHGIEALQLAGGPVSFVTLEGSDHLLVKRPGDPDFVADMIRTWGNRNLQ